MDRGDGGTLASADDLVACFLQCKQLQQTMRERSANGRATSGRYKKHDTARLRCLDRHVLPGLRMGKLPSDKDASGRTSLLAEKAPRATLLR